MKMRYVLIALSLLLLLFIFLPKDPPSYSIKNIIDNMVQEERVENPAGPYALCADSMKKASSDSKDIRPLDFLGCLWEPVN